MRVATRALVELSDELDETLGLGVWGNHGADHRALGRIEAARERQPAHRPRAAGDHVGHRPRLRGMAAAGTDGALHRRGSGQPEGGQPACRAPKAWRSAWRRSGASASCALVGIDDFSDLYGGSISALSVPVFDPDGAMVLALTAIGASDRLDTSETGKVVSGMRRCADRLTQRLRGSPAPSKN